MASQELPGGFPSHERGWALQIMTVLWHLVLNFENIARLVALLRLEPFSEICQYNPRFAMKSLGHNYLARNLNPRAALSCFIHHYRRMYSSFPDRILKMILHWSLPLYETVDDGHRFSLYLGTSKPYDKEGELSLLLKVDSVVIFNLAFTIVPGWAVGSDVMEAFLISRLQGERSTFHEVRLATKAMCNVRPRALLFAALQGVGLAVGVEEIDAVCAREQSSYCGRRHPSFQNSYDDFFTGLGLKKRGAGYFSSHIPIAEKPLESVDPSNRRTAKRKQAFKALVQMACARVVASALSPTQDRLGLEADVSSALEKAILVPTH